MTKSEVQWRVRVAASPGGPSFFGSLTFIFRKPSFLSCRALTPALATEAGERIGASSSFSSSAGGAGVCRLRLARAVGGFVLEFPTISLIVSKEAF